MAKPTAPPKHDPKDQCILCRKLRASLDTVSDCEFSGARHAWTSDVMGRPPPPPPDQPPQRVTSTGVDGVLNVHEPQPRPLCPVCYVDVPRCSCIHRSGVPDPHNVASPVNARSGPPLPWMRK